MPPLFVDVVLAAEPDLRTTEDGLRYRSETADRGGGIVVVTDVAADPERVLDVIIDVESRWTDVSALRSAIVTAREPDRMDVEYAFQCALGMQHTFDLVFHVDRERRTVRFEVDPSQPGFFDVLSGSYFVSENASGGTVLTYTSTVQTSSWAPKPLRTALVTDPALQEVAGIRDRAEGPNP